MSGAPLSDNGKTQVTTVFGALLILGGSIGYLKKGSLASLAAGGGIGASLVWLAQQGVQQNKVLIQALLALLFVVMLARGLASGLAMPRGIALASLANLAAVSY